MRFTITGTFTQTYEVEASYYDAVTPEEMLAEDIREYSRYQDRFIEDDFHLTVTGEIN